MVVEDAASALLAEDEHGHLLARGVDGRLEPGRTGAEDDNIVFLYLCHELISFRGWEWVHRLRSITARACFASIFFLNRGENTRWTLPFSRLNRWM